MLHPDRAGGCLVDSRGVRSTLRLTMSFPILLPLATCFALASPMIAQERELVVGRPVPDLRLPTIEGDATFDRRQLRGKRYVLIEFASW